MTFCSWFKINRLAAAGGINIRGCCLVLCCLMGILRSTAGHPFGCNRVRAIMVQVFLQYTGVSAWVPASFKVPTLLPKFSLQSVKQLGRKKSKEENNKEFRQVGADASCRRFCQGVPLPAVHTSLIASCMAVECMWMVRI